MKKIILLFSVCTMSMTAFSQTFKCPEIAVRNNGNNTSCPGDVGVSVNSSLSSSSYSIPTTKKEGTLTLSFDSKLTDVPLVSLATDASGVDLDVQFGPPTNWETKNNGEYLRYCFYKNDMPTAQVFVLYFKNGSSGNTYGTCTYDGDKLLSPPSIVTQPASKLNICKGDNYTFSCSATAQGNNTTLSYLWKKDGTNISGATTSSYSLSGVSNANNGDYTVVVTETYNNGNAISRESSKATLLVDAIKPTVETQNVTVNLDASGSASIAASQINNGSTDNCTISSCSLDKTSFNCNNLGSNTVILTVTDNNGNSATATATVTVLDAIAPVAKAKNYTVNLNASGVATIEVANIEDGSTDNCSVTSRSLSKTSFDCSNLGDNTVTLTVEDASGNKGTATATVTVLDAIAPVARTKNIDVTISNGADVTIAAADIENGSTDNCSIVSTDLAGQVKFGCADRGKTFTVTLTVKDASGNSNSANATVTVKGSATIAPDVSHDFKGLNNDGRYFFPYHSDKVKFTTSTQTGYSYAWTGNDISGSTSGSTIYVLPSKEGKLTLTATATDANGCTASSTGNICVFDIAVPNTSNSKVYVCHDKGSNAAGVSGYVTVEVSISGAKSHLTQHSKDAIGTCGKTYSCSNLSGRSKLADDNSEVGQLMDLGEHMSVLVYPNPSSDVFMIELESDEITTVSDVIITDVAGRIVESVKINPNDAIEVGKYILPGMYNIQVKNGLTVSSSRMVKK